MAGCLVLHVPRSIQAQQGCPPLLWNDEFDGTTLDSSKWTPQIGNGCDLGICGWGNNEWQYYTGRSENLSVNNGILQIRALREDFAGAGYTSARIQSRGLGDIDLAAAPTRVEAKVKVPGGQGLWSAAWMLPTAPILTSWPRYGEIDFLEFIGRQPFLVRVKRRKPYRPFFRLREEISDFSLSSPYLPIGARLLSLWKSLQ